MRMGISALAVDGCAFFTALALPRRRSNIRRAQSPFLYRSLPAAARTCAQHRAEARGAARQAPSSSRTVPAPAPALAAMQVVRAAAGGYTLMQGTSSAMAINVTINKSCPTSR